MLSNDELQPIKMVEIVTKDVGVPRNDGTPGSGLYAVPIRLSRTPSPAWASLLPQVWDRPPQYTNMHRPGIARVVGDRIILDGTTIEEFGSYHKETLERVIEEVNRRVAENEAAEQRQRAAEIQRQENHRRQVEEAAKRIKFD